MSVQDQGPGVAEADRDRLFEPYFHATSAGSGLGLAFCRLATTALGGGIEYETPTEGGARFRIRIPA